MWGMFVVHANKDDSKQEFFSNFWAKKKSGLCYTTDVIKDFPGSPSGKEPACQCRRCRRCWSDPWFGKIPWRRKWQPTPVFLPGKSYGQSPWLPSLQSQRVRWVRLSAARPTIYLWVCNLAGLGMASDFLLSAIFIFTDAYCFGPPSCISGSQTLARN